MSFKVEWKFTESDTDEQGLACLAYYQKYRKEKERNFLMRFIIFKLRGCYGLWVVTRAHVGGL